MSRWVTGGFYKGVGPRLTRVCLEVAITMSMYGEIVKALGKSPHHTHRPNPQTYRSVRHLLLVTHIDLILTPIEVWASYT